MRRALGEWLTPALIATLGLVFAADYGLGWPASVTWPVLLIVLGGFKAARGLFDEQDGPAAAQRRTGIFGPLAITLSGLLLLINNYYEGFTLATLVADMWPWALVSWGGFWMLEDFLARRLDFVRPRPLGSGSFVAALLICLIGMGLHGLFSEQGFLAQADIDLLNH